MGRVIDPKGEIRNRKFPCRVPVLLVKWYWMLRPSTTDIVEIMAEFIQLSAEGLAAARRTQAAETVRVPLVKIARAFSWTSPAANSERRDYFASAKRRSMVMLLPST